MSRRRLCSLIEIERRGGGEGAQRVGEWAEVRALAVDGVSQREIAARLGMNRRTVKRLAEAAEPPRYRRAPLGSMLDRLDPVLRKLVADFEDIKAPRVMELLREEYGYGGSVDLVRKRLAELRPKCERPAQKTGYRPGQVMQVDWAEMPTRPSVLGRERRVYALICALPFSGASTAHFTFDMTIESFLQGHVRAFDQERGSVTTGVRSPVHSLRRAWLYRPQRGAVSQISYRHSPPHSTRRGPRGR
jgi:transposase